MQPNSQLQQALPPADFHSNKSTSSVSDSSEAENDEDTSHGQLTDTTPEFATTKHRSKSSTAATAAPVSVNSPTNNKNTLINRSNRNLSSAGGAAASKQPLIMMTSSPINSSGCVAGGASMSSLMHQMECSNCKYINNSNSLKFALNEEKTTAATTQSSSSSSYYSKLFLNFFFCVMILLIVFNFVLYFKLREIEQIANHLRHSTRFATSAGNKLIDKP
jgi:hypothetical protein